jgi:(1->4)-alpha-D-glucan 1-alpha-D-glucosylmutase
VLHLPPGDWHDELTGRPVESQHVPVVELLDRYPVALLVRAVS